MTTLDDDSLAPPAAELADPPKRRRFAPRRSRSGAAPVGSIPEASIAAPNAGTAVSAPTDPGEPGAPGAAVAPAMTSPTLTTELTGQATQAEPAAAMEPETRSEPLDAPSAGLPAEHASSVTAASIPPPAPRGRRGRAKQPVPAPATTPLAAEAPDADPAPIAEMPAEPPAKGRRPARRARASTLPATPVTEASAVAVELPTVAEAAEPDPAPTIASDTEPVPATTAPAPSRRSRGRRAPSSRRAPASPTAALPGTATDPVAEGLDVPAPAGAAPFDPEPGPAPLTPGQQISGTTAPSTWEPTGAAASAELAATMQGDAGSATAVPGTLASAELSEWPIGTNDHESAIPSDWPLGTNDHAANGYTVNQEAAATTATDGYRPSSDRQAAVAPEDEDLLALAIRRLFPQLAPGDASQPEADPQDPETAEPYDALAGDQDDESPEDGSEEDLAALEAIDGVSDEDDYFDARGTADSDAAELARRRGRRGRRGGRGRRRNGLSALPPLNAEPAELPGSYAAEEAAPIAEPTVQEPAADLFVPETPTEQGRNWRDRGPRRQWGRTYSRDAEPTRMPPPKPSNGLRPGPIPQAAPPLAAVAAQPEIEIPAPTPFVLPDLGLDGPLAPGETRTERLLEVQTRLMQAMLEGQARQIEMLTGTVASLRHTVQGLSTGRGYLPRTSIFVDAPNVCYAADNARVQLDYGRMLKYLSRDRQLVHALSYAPITDDVQEGIRYETQRFVAPFLRTGYRMVTKPLKRFPDGSAKGNFDIELALDIVTMSERLDVVVLVSGDSDFERLIQLIQSKGVRVEVVAFASNVSTELVNIADVFIDISQHLEHMRPL